MKKLLCIKVLIALNIFGVINTQAQSGKNIYYVNGNITYSAREGKPQSDKDRAIEEYNKSIGLEVSPKITIGDNIPLGIKVTVIYNDFFKNYKIQFTDSKGNRKEIIFENKPQPPGYQKNPNDLPIQVTNSGCTFIILDNLSSLGTLFLSTTDNCQVWSYTIKGCVKSKKQ